MSLPRKSALIQGFIEAIKLSGWNVLVIRNGHPAKLAIFREGTNSSSVLLYIWNMTHGGSPRNPNELRIQITGVDHFFEEAGVKTLVLGWSDNLQLFSGYDVTKHRHLGYSPSFQIRREAMEKARAIGFCAQEKGNDEIAIAFRLDFAATYVQELEALHQSGSRKDLTVLEEIAKAAAEPRIHEIPPGPRKTVLQQLQRKVRDARFRSNIMSVYEHRCAISGIQLDLLEAAHIVPVEHEAGTDEIKNGICLSAIHHRAFDNGLIGIRTDYTVLFNEKKLGQLRSIGWDGGTDVFKSTLRDHIILPRKTEHYPSADYLLYGQKLRGWSDREIKV
ncbi:MAG: HNH endonuclease [Verrucomicrobiia bacterium]